MNNVKVYSLETNIGKMNLFNWVKDKLELCRAVGHRYDRYDHVRTCFGQPVWQRPYPFHMLPTGLLCHVPLMTGLHVC